MDVYMDTVFAYGYFRRYRASSGGGIQYILSRSVLCPSGVMDPTFEMGDLKPSSLDFVVITLEEARTAMKRR